MKRWRQRLLLWSVLLLAGAVAGGVLWLRTHRDQHDSPSSVTASVSRVRNLFVDVYAARAGKKVLLFDAGIDPSGKAIDDLLAQLHASRADVSDIFITHGHGDHIAAAPLFPGAKVHASSRDVDMMRDKSLAQPALAIASGWVLPAPYVNAVALGEDGLVPVEGGAQVRAFAIPGHTPGSMAYLYDGVLFVGDSMRYKDGKLGPAPALFSVDVDENRRSLKALKQSLAGLDVKVICTGHEGCTQPGEAAKLFEDWVASAP